MLNLKKILLALLLFGCLLTVPARELAQIIKAGKLRAAVLDTATPPFMTRNEKKEFQGFELDLLKSCAETLGVKLELINVDTFDGLVDALVKDQADVAMSQLSRTLPRILKVDFSRSYAKPHLALMINRQEILRMRKNKTLDNFLRHYDGPLVVQKIGCRIVQVKDLFPKAKLIWVKNREEVEKLLKKRVITAYFDDQITIRSLMESHTGFHLFYQRVILEDSMDRICVAVQPGCPRLLFFLNCFLEDNMVRINSFLNPFL